MDEQVLDSSIEEVAPQETEHDVSQQPEQKLEAENQAREEAKERDWRAMRQRHKEMEMELRQKNELLDRFLQQQQPRAVQEVAEPEDPDEEYIPAGRVKGIARKTVQPLEQKINELNEKLAQMEQQKLISSLRTTYSDFDDIVNVETLEMLEKTEPELAATIAQFKDPYKMGLHSYKYIKALGLVDKLPETRRSKEVVQKLEKNAKAVQSPTAYDKRPIAQAFKSTQADKTRLYEEMMFFAGQATGL